MVELGNYTFPFNGQPQFEYVVTAQSDPLMKWDVINRPNELGWKRPNTNVIFMDVGDYKVSYVKFTDFAWIQSRFDMATQYKNQYEYATYLLHEELFHPAVRAEWKANPISEWSIDGTYTIAGQIIELLKTWCLRVNGSWDQAWFDRIKADTVNGFYDPLLKQWSVEYALKLHKAWVTHIRSIGKKCAILGLTGLNGWQSIDWSYPGELRTYVLQNFDMIVAYTYPTCISGCQWSLDKAITTAKSIRDAGFTGKLNWIITANWNGNNSVGTNDINVEYEEYKAVAPYADIITCTAFVNVAPFPGTVLYPPRLINFYNTYNPCPQPICDSIITQV